MPDEERLQQLILELDFLLCEIKDYTFQMVEDNIKEIIWNMSPEPELREVLDLLQYIGDTTDV